MIQVGENDQLTFVSGQIGFNESIVNSFIAEKTIQLVSEEKFESTAEKVKSLHAKEFQKWRSNRLANFFTDLNDAVVAKSNKRLIIDSSKVILDSDQQPPLLRGKTSSEPWLDRGITNESLAKKWSWETFIR